MKRKICAMLLAMSMVVSMAMPAGAEEVKKQSSVSVIEEAPPVPNVTKFWMSGWEGYWVRMETNLQVGTCVYSIDPDPCTTGDRNKEYEENHPDKFRIKEVPEKFLGCDYIITRKDNSSGIHFRAEQKIDVYVAIDEDNSEVPTSHNRFTKTGDKVKLNNGNTYFLAKRTFDEGSTVQLASADFKKYKGDNVFYLILPAEGETVSKALTKNPVVEEGKKPDKNSADEKYQYYLNDVFNQYTEAGIPKGYTGENAKPSGEPTTTEEKSYESEDNLALEKPYTYNSRGYEGSPVDGKASTYWESEGLPGKLTINLEGPTKINQMKLKLRENWGDRSQKLKIEVSTDGSEFETLVEEKEYAFKRNDKNTVNIEFKETTAQYVRVSGTANSEQNDIQIGEVELYGPTQTVTLVHVDENKNRHGIINDGGELTRTFDQAITGKVVFEGKVKSSAKDKEMSIPLLKSEDGKTAVDLKFSEAGTIKAGTTKVADYEKDTWYTIKLLIDMDTATYEVWVDHIRKVQNVKFSSDAKNIKTMTFSSTAGELNVDNLRFYDNPEVFIVDNNFNKEATGAIPAGWTYTNPKQVSVEEVPFAEDKSMLLEGKGTSAVTTFDPITGDATIEAKVKPMENSWASVPVIKDSKGNVAVKIAAYRNSFFACNGNNWEYICSQELPNNYYPAANWYQVKVVLNTYSNRYDLYIDGAKRCGDLSFATDVEDIASVSYTLEEENKLYVDNVKVFDSASLARGLYPKENVYNVKDFGAKGDGKTDDTAAIEKAIQTAEYTGGTVLLENGVFYCGQIDMLNDMTLFIDTSAEIYANMNRDVYTQFVPSRGRNAHFQLGKGIIRSVSAENFRITGGGVLNGNGLYAWGENDPTDSRRPCAMYLTLSKDVYVENINIVSSPFWTLVPFESGNLTMRNIGITNSNAPNRDGIDPTSCWNYTIENCYVIAGDDAFCPKNGNDIESINCDIRNVFLQSYCNGIKFGTDSYGGFKNYNMEDIWMKCVGLSGITLQSSDGSEFDNIKFKRIEMNDVDNCFAFMVGNRKRTYSGGGDYKKIGDIKNVILEDVNYTNPMVAPYSHQGEKIHEALLIGLNPKDKETIQDGKEATHRISNVLFKNVYMEMTGGVREVPKQPRGILNNYPEHGAMCDDGEGPVGWAYTMRWADNINFENCTNVLLKSDARKEYSYNEYTSNKIEPCTIGSSVKQIPYGIVFEVEGKTIEAPAISGTIGEDSEVTVLTDSLLKVFQEDYDLELNHKTFENAIIKCASDGSLQLLDSTGTVVLAEAKNEKFLNEDGTRQVFHVSDKEIDVPEVCYVTFDADGKRQIVRVPKGKAVDAVAEPKKQGYEFTGWYLEDQAFDFKTVIDQDITLTAKFEEKEDASKDDQTGDVPSKDDPAGEDGTGDDTTKEDGTGDDTTKEDETGDDTTKEDGTGDDTTKEDGTGDDTTKEDGTGDDTTKEDGTGDDTTKEDKTGDDTTKEDETGDDTTKEDETGDNTPKEDETGKDTTKEDNSGNDTTKENETSDDSTKADVSGGTSLNNGAATNLPPKNDTSADSFQPLSNDSDSVFAKLQARAKKQTRNSVKLSWKAVEGADGYVVYGSKCGKNNSNQLLEELSGKQTTTYTHKGLDKGTYYKYIVYAYKNEQGKKVELAVSKTIYTVTAGSKYGEVKKITVRPAKVKVKVGKSSRISAKEVKSASKMKKYRKLSYESDNTAVATVSKSGKIKARKKGTCNIYVYAQNGVCKKVKVTVK